MCLIAWLIKETIPFSSMAPPVILSDKTSKMLKYTQYILNIWRLATWKYMLMGWCKKDVTPLLTHWSYVFLALTYGCVSFPFQNNAILQLWSQYEQNAKLPKREDGSGTEITIPLVSATNGFLQYSHPQYVTVAPAAPAPQTAEGQKPQVRWWNPFMTT